MPPMRTTLYLLRHAATDANLAQPARLQGRRDDRPLAPLGLRQAAATRDFLAVRPIDACYTSPLQRAKETAAIVAAPHGLKPIVLDELTECDVGAWEGLDWATVRNRDPEAYRQYMADPASFAYPGGESFSDVFARASDALDRIMAKHAGQTILAVTHHVVTRTYLAAMLGLPLRQARSVALENCGISVVVRTGDIATVSTLNAAFHLQGVAA
jgi:broad specificity phosphatase PhoE